MKHKPLKLCVMLLLILGLSGLNAQEVITVSGGDASNQEGSVSYSLGLLFYTIDTTTTGTVSQGLQQPFEISVVSGIEEAKWINISVFAYPNPTTDIIMLSVDPSFLLSIPSLSYQLFDLRGKILKYEKMESSEIRIPMSHLMPSTYFLKVRSGAKTVKTFSIIKY